MSEKNIEIWPVETGITDFNGNWHDLESSGIRGLRVVWRGIRQELEGTGQLEQFTEKMNREWAIETGIIENLYDISRGVTLSLIEHGFRADLISHGDTDKPADYVLKLLGDQRDALEGIFDFVASRRDLTTAYIKELHAALTRSQTHTTAQDFQGQLVEVELLRGDWKRHPNNPERGGVTIFYCPPEQVASEMDRLIEFYKNHIQDGVSPEVSAAFLHHRFTQIHPFQDGNGRVARALASLILIKEGLFPLVIFRDDKIPYLDSLEAADAGNLRPFIEIIAKQQRIQFRRATALADAVHEDQQNINALLDELEKTADAKVTGQTEDMSRVFDRAQELEGYLEQRLNAIGPKLKAILQRIDPSSGVQMTRSTAENDYYFKGQIIQNAKEYLNYFADTLEYRSWVSLTLYWKRRAKLVYATHSIGRPFSGSLVCAPFLEFYDKDEEGTERAALVPVTDEPFVFFHTDNKADIQRRFDAWLDASIAVFIKELRANL
jgi:Fic family protein